MLHSDTFKDEIQSIKLPSFQIKKNLSSAFESNALKISPKPFTLRSWTFSMDSHEANDWFVAGFMDGTIEIFDYSNFSKVETILSIKEHENAIQDIHFMSGGNRIISADSRGNVSIYDMKKKKNVLKIKEAHDGASIHKVIECIPGHVIATGDENGLIRIWDIKTKNMIREIDEHSLEITGFSFNQDLNALYASSDDGSVSHIEISQFNENEKIGVKRKELSIYRAKLYDISRPTKKKSYSGVMDIMNGEIIICSTTSGKLNIYKYGKLFQTPSAVEVDALSIDHLVFLKENIVCIINNEGGINSFRLKKNNDIWDSTLAKHIGDHEEGVTCVTIDSEGKFLITAGNDQYVRFFDTRDLFGLNIEFDNEVENKELKPQSKASDSIENTITEDSESLNKLEISSTITEDSQSSKKRVGYLDPTNTFEKRKKRKHVSKRRDFFSGLML